MANIPNIVVRLVHIEGPLLGKEQEFSDDKIKIGRYSDCHVRYPKDYRVISKYHAKIIREGNRFKLIDKNSLNGTYVQGKRIREAYLKRGDVLMFAQGGPKVSFLTEIKTEIKDEYIEEIKEDPIESQIPLVILYGPYPRKFKKLPVTIGKDPKCDFFLNHPAVFDKHAQISFRKGQYWVKDLTGRQTVLINGQPINVERTLNPDNQLALSPQGPMFRFQSGGYLVEIED